MAEGKRKPGKATCLGRALVNLLLGLAIFFGGMKLFSDWLIRQGEAKYPPFDERIL